MFMCISKDCSAESQKRGLTPFIFSQSNVAEERRMV